MKTIAQQLNWDFKTFGDLVINDKNGNRIYSESSDGLWIKWKYDSQNNQIYFERSDEYWAKWEYDSQGKEIYWEDTNGVIRDKRPKPCENKIIEIEGVKYKLTKV
jgi:hypothetical protein